MSKESMQWMRLATVGTHFAVAMGIGFWIGKNWLDPLFGTYPTFTVFLALCGIAAGFLNLFKEVEMLNRSSQEGEAGERDEDSASR
jgi:F0F1-type ATP synthase assembly protein I